MKKLLFILISFVSVNSFSQNKLGLLLAPNTKQIVVNGSGDTTIIVKRLLLAKSVHFNGIDSSVDVTFTPFRNLKEYRKAQPFNVTDVNVSTQYYKVPPANLADYDTYVLQQAKAYYISLGYSVNIQ